MDWPTSSINVTEVANGPLAAKMAERYSNTDMVVITAACCIAHHEDGDGVIEKRADDILLNPMDDDVEEVATLATWLLGCDAESKWNGKVFRPFKHVSFGVADNMVEMICKDGLMGDGKRACLELVGRLKYFVGRQKSLGKFKHVNPRKMNDVMEAHERHKAWDKWLRLRHCRIDRCKMIRKAEAKIRDWAEV